MSAGTYSGTYTSTLQIYQNSATITSTGAVLDTTSGEEAISIPQTGVTLVNQGMISANDSNGIGVYFDNSGVLSNTGSIHGDTGVSMYSGGTVLNRGVISGYSLAVFLNTGVFTNAASATIGITGDSGTGVQLNGNAKGSNAGLIQLQNEYDPHNTAVKIVGVDVTSDGSFNNTGRIDLIRIDDFYGSFIGITAASGGVVMNSGTINAGRDNYGFYGSSVGQAGHGSVAPDGLHFDTDQNYGVGIALTNSSAFNSGTIIGRNLGMLLGGSSYLQNSGKILGYPAGILLDAGTVVNTGEVEAFAAHYSAGVAMNAGVLINSGTIKAIGTYDSYGIYAPNAGVISITNLRGGMISGLIGIDFEYSTGQTLTNAGTIVSTVGASGIAVQFNSGDDLLLLRPGSTFVGRVDGGQGYNTIELGTRTGVGTLTGLGAYVTNFQAITVDAGASWVLNGDNTLTGLAVTDNGLLKLAGTTPIYGAISGTGTLVLGGNDTLYSSSDIGVPNLNIASGTTTLGTPGFNTTFSGNFGQSGGTLALGGNYLFLDGAAGFTGGAISGSGTLVTNSSVSVSAMALNRGAVWQDAGMATATGSLTLGNAGGGSGELTVLMDGGVFDITGNGGIAVAPGGKGMIENGGVFQKTGGGGTSIISATMIDTGTITVTSGALEFIGAGSSFSGPISGSGTIQFGGGSSTLTSSVLLTVAHVRVTGGTLTLAHDVSCTGTFAESGGTVALGGNKLGLTKVAVFGGGTVSGSGYLVTRLNVGLARLTVAGGAIWQIYGQVTETGTLTLGNAGGGTGRLTSEAGSVFDIVGNGGIAVAAGGSGMVISQVLFEKTGGTGTSVIAASMTDTSTISVKTGALDFTGATNSFAGTISGAGTVQFGAGKSALESKTALSVAHVVVSGGTLAFGASLSYVGNFTQSGGSTMLGGKTLSLMGAANFNGGAFVGGGVLTTRKAVGIKKLTIAGDVWQNYGVATAVGSLTLGGAGGIVGRLTTEAGATFDIIANGGIAAAAGGTASVINLGLFEKTVGTGTSIVAPSFTNSGTIKVTAGMLDLTGAVTGTGNETIAAAGTLEFGGTVAATQAVTFAGTSRGELYLNDPSGSGLAFAGSVAGFAGKDRLDLATFAFSGKPKLAWSQGSGKGTLTVTDGSKIAKLILFGQYTAAGFHATGDGGAGTLISYTAPAKAADLAPPHH